MPEFQSPQLVRFFVFRSRSWAFCFSEVPNQTRHQSFKSGGGKNRHTSNTHRRRIYDPCPPSKSAAFLRRTSSGFFRCCTEMLELEQVRNNCKLIQLLQGFGRRNSKERCPSWSWCSRSRGSWLNFNGFKSIWDIRYPAPKFKLESS